MRTKLTTCLQADYPGLAITTGEEQLSAFGFPFPAFSCLMASLDIDAFPEPGLYLLFPDGHRLDLTDEVIIAATRRFLADAQRLPPEVKAAAEFQLCSICPKRETAEICHAIMATLPFIDAVDRYLSYDSVTAVFRARGSDILHVSRTTMQEAIKYLAMLSVMHYCEVGRKFFPYFRGVNPLMPSEDIATQVFRNLYFDCRGNEDGIRAIINRMQTEIRVTTRCQMDRLRLICHNDVFLNALVAVHSTAAWLDFDLAGLNAAACPQT
jgi:hypothetical protein